MVSLFYGSLSAVSFLLVLAAMVTDSWGQYFATTEALVSLLTDVPWGMWTMFFVILMMATEHERIYFSEVREP